MNLTGWNDPRVQLSVYDLLGHTVARLYDGPLASGVPYTFTLDAAKLSAGLYVVRIRGDSARMSRIVFHTR